jgi:hypothetical protein
MQRVALAVALEMLLTACAPAGRAWFWLSRVVLQLTTSVDLVGMTQTILVRIPALPDAQLADTIAQAKRKSRACLAFSTVLKTEDIQQMGRSPATGFRVQSPEAPLIAPGMLLHRVGRVRWA